jgi:hypothetical protein
MKTIQITDEEYDFLVKLKHELNTQDNRITANPIFLVQEETKEIGHEEFGCTDGYDIVEQVTGDYSTYETKCEAYRDLLEMGHGKEDIRDEVVEVPYRIRWETIQCCFTEKGAQSFIDIDKHNHKKLRIYVDGLYRNKEMITLRNLLFNLTLEQ